MPNAPNADKTITIYCRWVNPDGRVKPMRRVLYNCSWEERSIATALQTGNVLNEPASIRIFCDTSGKTYIPPHEWDALNENELDKYWTADLTREAHPLIVPLESTWETNFDSEANITRAENDFLRSNPDATRISKRNDNRGKHGSHMRLQA